MEDNRCYVQSHANKELKRYIPVITEYSMSLKTRASKNSSENLETFVDTIANDPISISFSGVMMREDIDFFLNLRNSRDLVDFKFVKTIDYTYEGFYISSLTFKEGKEKSTTVEFSMTIEEVKQYEFLKVTMIQVDETEIEQSKDVSIGKIEANKVSNSNPWNIPRNGIMVTTDGRSLP